MKKILFILLSLTLFISNVNADTYSPWEELIIGTDDMEVETEIRYRYYRESINGEYLTKGLNDNYEYEEENNYIYSDYSELQKSCPEGDKYEKETMTVYPYMEVKKTRYIVIDNNNEDLLFDRIKIYYDGNKIDYNIVKCDNCDLMFFVVYQNGRIELDLKDTYDTKKLSMEIVTNNSKYSDYNIRLYNNRLYSKSVASIMGGTDVTFYQVDSAWILDTDYTDILYSFELIEKDPFNILYMPTKKCRYRELLTYHYNIEKEYYDDNYYAFLDNGDYLRDEQDYKIYYRYLINEDDLGEIEIPEEIINEIEDIDQVSNNITEVEEEIVEQPEVILEIEEPIETIQEEQTGDIIEEVPQDELTNNKEIPLINTLDVTEKNLNAFPIFFIVVLMIGFFILIVLKKKMSTK